MAAFVLRQQSWVVMTGTVRLPKSKMFTLWLFIGFCSEWLVRKIGILSNIILPWSFSKTGVSASKLRWKKKSTTEGPQAFSTLQTSQFRLGLVRMDIICNETLRCLSKLYFPWKDSNKSKPSFKKVLSISLWISVLNKSFKILFLHRKYKGPEKVWGFVLIFPFL